MITFFIVIQTILLLFMLLHDWIDIPPFTDIKALRNHHSVKELFIGTVINTVFVGIPFLLTLLYASASFPLWAAITMVCAYILLTIGTICAWWIPYICGSSQKHKADFAEYQNTHHFLPARGDNVIPNTLHVTLHLFVWASLACAVYILVLCC